MAQMHKLTQKQINEAARKPCDTAYRMSDGSGLSLMVRPGGSMYWSVQVTIKVPYGQGKRVEVGLGPYPSLALADAREAANGVRDTAASGIDPRAAKTAALVAATAPAPSRPTLEAVCKLTFEAKKAELKGGGVNGRWYSPLELHLLPELGQTPIEEITPAMLVNVLRPLWLTKGETASKVIDRLGMAFKYASAMDLDVSLETMLKVKVLLGAQPRRPQHIPSMPWQEVPAFYASLNEDLVTHLALKFLILTGARSYPVRFARADEMRDNVWWIPAANMKGGEAFEIPLSTEAQRLVTLAAESARDGYLFPSPKKGVISDTATIELMKGRELSYRPHGFRSSLRDWMTEETDTPWDTKEKVLAHKVGDATSRAYDRTKDLKRRATIMEAWSQHCTKAVING
ncbi:integrase arm-type DNA-binding domain-containing protein [Agrobacterium tumefaciens]|uniref:tyrosine-type recombinase/integrase n=1 Tax=Agrobacterium tumefaciens TaxID=358 RepID=UPI0015742818|nr:site-specific integrase [Agrobacterium tumefaciens]NSZ83632.1 integrase arm-type DNA-binding domain-containing protein [Agrobacterium tumefaciens]WCA69841.1 integrase arm-type DNA-binding domain-containing protein [Agrobacterium tumefaciens]